MDLSALIWGSISTAVSSFSPLPSKEKILFIVVMVAKPAQTIIFGFGFWQDKVCLTLCLF
jgi:hypothetical protein